MSDNLSARWNKILHMTNKDTTDEVVIARSNFDDFSQPTPWRTYELVAGERTFYVNAGWLAELSPYFAEIIFVRKPPQRKFIFDEATPTEVLEFLRCITFCPMRKPLSVKNVSLVLRFANRFDMKPVQARCEQFIALNANTICRDKNKLFQVTCAMSQCDPNSSTMSVLVDKLAGIKAEDLSRLAFSEMPGDVVAEVFEQRMQKSKAKRRQAAEQGCCVMQWFSSVFRRRRTAADEDDCAAVVPFDQQTTIPHN
ncbi:unnamed protein product [Caenorhabditis bovis]|uniref:BTB domain-containing protein n=1 Tax=Caenorhabditis bovis TaxID=2654633 RepID=A0A8S1EKY7_9PELO|nr:unnamed protein product [Caenorhabditis bovis]